MSPAAFPDPVRAAGTYTITVGVGDRSESYTWETPATDAYGVVVHVEETGIEFSERVN